jgi:hypothetical protein
MLGEQVPDGRHIGAPAVGEDVGPQRLADLNHRHAARDGGVVVGDGRSAAGRDQERDQERGEGHQGGTCDQHATERY